MIQIRLPTTRALANGYTLALTAGKFVRVTVAILPGLTNGPSAPAPPAHLGLRGIWRMNFQALS